MFAPPVNRLMPLVVALAIGLAAMGHLPIIDDEANAIQLALSGVGPALQAGLGGHFHPPLNDLIQSAWFALVTPSLWLARLPALCWWLATCALLPWCLEPLLPARERGLAVWSVVSWPVHWVFPFLATWYSLAALLSVLSTGAFLRAVRPEPGSSALVSRILWAVTLTALGYTTFAWPGLLAAHAWLYVRTVEPGASVHAHDSRMHWAWQGLRPLLPFVVGVACALAPTFMLMADRMSYAARGEAGGGGLVPVGAVVALLAGPTVPASPAILLAACAVTSLGGLLLLRNTGRDVRTLFAAGCAMFLTLLATRTLSDKRLLLFSVPMVAALGAAIAATPRRSLHLCLILGSVPAAVGWCFPGIAPLLFPRWSDPQHLLAESHCAQPEERVFFADHPALMLAVTARCGDLSRYDPDGNPIVGLLDGEFGSLYALPQFGTIDLVAFLDSPEGWLAPTVTTLKQAGFRITGDRSLGADVHARWRDDRQRTAYRFHWVRLQRTPEEGTHGSSAGVQH